MKTLLSAVLLLAMMDARAAAAPNAEVAAPIHQFIDSFNKGDVDGAEAAHTTTGLIIIDEVAPYQWQGTNVFKTWLADLTKRDAARGVTDGNVRLSDVIREETDGDRAYVVMAAVYSFKAHGKPMREGAQMTFALRKEATGWRIGGWTFAGAKPTPASP